MTPKPKPQNPAPAADGADPNAERDAPLTHRDSPAAVPTNVVIDGLRSGYDHGPDIVKGVSLTANPGEVTTLLGPNGCGKSTLLRSVSRLLAPRAGTVHIGTDDVFSLKPREAALRIALQPQTPIAPEGLRVGELIARGRYPHRDRWRGESAHDRERVFESAESTQLTELLDRDVASLSGGQRQRAWFAMALAQETPVLLLDEPTTYLDPAHAVEMLDLVRSVARAGRTVVMVLHDLMLAGMFSDRMVMMRSGEIVADGTPAEVLTADTLDEVYGLKADIVADPKSDVPIIVPRTTSGYSLSSRPSPASSTP
ncbi:ABC transporter ATP-binding protein [Dietzia sp.]|uniref:ABC transporter ATP-binding protein n=1 Tax=Dietzia sp. TaxID=1871616 RepID=UPI002FDA04C4